METKETAITQDVCQGQQAGEQMPSVGNGFEGEAQPTQREASEPGDTLDITVSTRVHVLSTDSVDPLLVETCPPTPAQAASRVTSAPLSAQASIPSSTGPSALRLVQTSAHVPARTSASELAERLTHLPLQHSSFSPPVHPASMSAPPQTQSCAALSVHTCEPMHVPQPAPTATGSPQPNALSLIPGLIYASHPTQSSPSTPAEHKAFLAVQASVLCFAPLPMHTSPLAQWAVQEEVGAHFEACLEEVGVLERSRDALVRELLQLEQPMMQAVQTLQAELAQACGHLTRAQLRLLWLQEDVRQVKRKMLSVARRCIQSQVELSALQYEVAQSGIMQEELQSQVLDHLQAVAQLREDHKKQMDSLRNNQKKRRRPRPTSDLSHCRRFSDDLSRYTCDNMKMLEDWYEPRVLALLRRRQTTEEVLRRSRELTEELRTRLLPLQEQVHELALQKNCLEQKIALMEQDREESVTRYKEGISCLEESMRELKTELQMQRMANVELTQLKNSLMLELQSYGCSIGEHTGTANGGAEDM